MGTADAAASPSGQLHVAVALDGYGWHRLAWRSALRDDPGAPSALSGDHWAALAVTAERGLLDFVTVDDTLTPQPGRRAHISPGRLAGRGDAVLAAARMAAATEHIGVIPVATVTHTVPQRVARAIATLDALSAGRAGWQVRVSTSAHEAALFGRGGPGAPDALFDDAVDSLEVARRCWADADPSPPQGQPVIAALAHATRVYEFASAAADLVFITPGDDDELQALLAEVAALGDLRVYADAVVTFGGDTAFGSDAVILDDGPEEIAELIVRWHDIGVHGVRLRPAVQHRDLPVIVDRVVPLLQRTGRFRSAYADGETLRTRLGLRCPADRNVATP
ncbi:hypothetical protein A5727_01625 [Mycobacterium sp. ACS4331]|nr:hypothetical protein A5727_01625 [Mycobacterium sp. ACS4331]